jgi:ketosteroid isomerase-like protein
MKSTEMPQTQILHSPDRLDTPTEREEVAARLFDAFNRRELPAVLELVHPEIVFLPVSAAVMSDGQPYRGHEGMRCYLRDVEAHWSELIVRPVQIRAAGEAVVALGRVSGRGPAGALEDVSTTWVLKFRDNLVVHAQIFSDDRPLREAFGLDT